METKKNLINYKRIFKPMEPNKNEIFFVTGNLHKFNEIKSLFIKENINYELKHKELNTIEIQSDDLEEIALFKLNSVKSEIEGSYFIEDAGFFVDFPLNGFPGIWSKYIFKTIGNQGILKLIDNYKTSKAHFETIIAYYHQPWNKTFTFKGKVKGKVAERVRGKGGFGFDPIFIPDEYPDKTFAELSVNEKNDVSHRGKAFKMFLQFLKETV